LYEVKFRIVIYAAVRNIFEATIVLLCIFFSTEVIVSESYRRSQQFQMTPPNRVAHIDEEDSMFSDKQVRARGQSFIRRRFGTKSKRHHDEGLHSSHNLSSTIHCSQPPRDHPPYSTFITRLINPLRLLYATEQSQGPIATAVTSVGVAALLLHAACRNVGETKLRLSDVKQI
jgi:hypothetical protein